MGRGGGLKVYIRNERGEGNSKDDMWEIAEKTQTHPELPLAFFP